jgi:predicted negative regulator of RcsB-dependent stress response
LASYASDEEQLEALKNWWKENGSSLITGVAIVLVVFFGARWWQDSRQATAEAASEIYDGIIQQIALVQDSGIDDATLAAMESSYDTLRNDFSDNIYSRFGALLLASVYVEQENFSQAEAELQWVLDNQELGFMKSAEQEVFLIARVRLARVLIAQDRAQEALNLLSEVEPGTMAATYAEVQGDAYAQLGQAEQARAAYERAINLGPGNASFIDLKMRGLGG